jgi:hypothetical protein
MSHTWLSKFIDKISRRHRRGTLLGDETLLDLQIRAYLRSEYANEIPPSGAFPRLMRAVQLHREEQQLHAEAHFGKRISRNIRRLGHALPRLYHTLGRGDAARVISSGMVTALMLFAIWPSIRPMLSNNYLAPSLNVSTSNDGNGLGDRTLYGIPTETSVPGVGDARQTSPSNVDEQRILLMEWRLGQDLGAPFEDPNYLHPFERGLGKKAAPSQSDPIPQSDPIRDRPIIGQD